MRFCSHDALLKKTSCTTEFNFGRGGLLSAYDRYVEIEAEDEARLAIADAISNHWKLERGESEEVKCFAKWAREYAVQNMPVEKL
jgi:hypothetical protein